MARHLVELQVIIDMERTVEADSEDDAANIAYRDVMDFLDRLKIGYVEQVDVWNVSELGG